MAIYELRRFIPSIADIIVRRGKRRWVPAGVTSPTVAGGFKFYSAIPERVGVLLWLTHPDTAMAETRKLAAILAADVAGYSRLAAADEERTLARLRMLRSDLIDPTIGLHHGRVVKRTGVGTLVEFRSVVDAVRCAIEVQNGMVERNAGLPPERLLHSRS